MDARTILIAVLAATSSIACDDLEPPDPTYDAGLLPVADAGPDAAVPAGGPHVRHAPEAAGMRTSIDASSYADFVHLDLDTGLEVDSSDASWDLRFQRFAIELNGGASGTGGVEAVVLDGASFDATSAAPADGYVTDTAEADVFATWYEYDEGTHVLTPLAKVYVVRTTEDATYAIAMTGYYNGAGTSGNPSFLWKPL